MYIARQKRSDNIAEYILYLWQLEDLLRALGMSRQAVMERLVAPMGLNPEQSRELLEWYMSLCGLLREEGKAQSGHLRHTLDLIGQLQELHSTLMTTPGCVRYREMFNALAEELPRLRIVLARDGVSDIELCFRALYAVTLYRLRGDSAKEEVIGDVIGTISPVIGMLAGYFHSIETGGGIPADPASQAD